MWYSYRCGFIAFELGSGPLIPGTSPLALVLLVITATNKSCVSSTPGHSMELESLPHLHGRSCFTGSNSSGGLASGNANEPQLGSGPRGLPPSHSLLATCYYLLHAKMPSKMAPSQFVAVSRRRQGVVRQNFANVRADCWAVVATTKRCLSKKGDARHPLEFSRGELSKVPIAYLQPEASLLRHIGSCVAGLGEQR